jgi:hypothetical protein
MACHVYNPTYCKVMTITINNMQFEDTNDQQIMWTNFNDMMQKHSFPKLNFKGFMVNNTQANWNVVKIVYGPRDPSMRMIDKERTCLFHWT